MTLTDHSCHRSLAHADLRSMRERAHLARTASLEFGGFGRRIARGADFLGFSGDAGRGVPFPGAREAQGISEQAGRRPKIANLEASARLTAGAPTGAMS